MKNKLNIMKFGMYRSTPFLNIKQFFKNLKYAYQRIKWGFSAPDTWNFDWYLCHLISDALRYLAAHCNGAPEAYYDKEHDSLQPWVNKLNSLAGKFEAAAEGYDTQEIKKLFEEFAEIFYDLWD